MAMGDSESRKALMFPAAALLVLGLGSFVLSGFELWGVHAWFVVYAAVKFGARVRWGAKSWDIVSLLHNVLSVVAGAAALWEWQVRADR